MYVPLIPNKSTQLVWKQLKVIWLDNSNISYSPGKSLPTLYGGTSGSSQRLNHSSRKVNTLSTCCLLQQVVQHDRRLPAFQLFHAGGPWYSGIYAASPPFNHRGLTDKLIVGLGSPQLLIPLQHNTSQSMKLQYNAWAAKKRGVLACWATGRNLLLLPPLLAPRCSCW